MVTNFEFRVFIIIFDTKVSMLDVLDFTSIGFILVVLWYILLYLLTLSSNLSIYAFFDTEAIHL